jgi:hypothetical protein
MKLRIAADSIMELIAGGLLIAGIFLLVGLAPALLTGAFVAVCLAEFSWAGKVWSVPLPTRTNKLARKARKNARKVQQEIRQSVADLEARKIEAGLE